MKRSSFGSVVLILLMGVVAFANSFRGPFVLDDVWAIRDNPTLRQLWPLSGPLTPIPGGITVSGRPILNLSFAINYAISGTEVWSYHAANLLIHLLAALTLFGLTRRTLPRAGFDERPSRILATAIALLWVAHPLQTESVTYIVQRAESLVGLFCLLTFYALARGAASSHPWRWYAGALAACALGMGTKELMAATPVLVLCYDRAFLAGSFLEAWRKRWTLYVALAATWIPLIWLVSLTGMRDGTYGSDVTPLAYALIQIQGVTRYLGLAFWPHPLVFEYGVIHARSAMDVVPFALVLVPLLTLTVIGFVRNRPWAFAGVFFCAILAPTSSFLPGNRQTFAEHRMYLPLAAVLTLAIIGLHLLFRRRIYRTALVAAAATLAFAGATLARNRAYQSDLALYADSVAKRPNSAYARFGYGSALLGLGRAQEALVEFEAALAIDDKDKAFHLNRGQALLRLDRPAEAVIAFEDGFRRGSVEPSVLATYAEALERVGRRPEAIAQWERLTQLEPNNLTAHLALGDAHTRDRNWDKAMTAYQNVLRHPPPAELALRAHVCLGDALAFSDRMPEAEPHYRAALAIDPNLAPARTNLGAILVASGKVDEGIVELQAAARLRPNHARSHAILGDAYAAAGRSRDAVAAYETALSLEPNNSDLRKTLTHLKAQP